MLFEKLNYSVAGHNSFSCCWLKFFPFSYSFHLLTFLPPKAGHVFWCLDTRVNFLMTRPYNAQHEIYWNPLVLSVALHIAVQNAPSYITFSAPALSYWEVFFLYFACFLSFGIWNIGPGEEFITTFLVANSDLSHLEFSSSFYMI